MKEAPNVTWLVLTSALLTRKAANTATKAREHAMEMRMNSSDVNKSRIVSAMRDLRTTGGQVPR